MFHRQSTVSPRTLTFTLLNTRFLRKHAVDITSNSHLTEINVLFLTETQLADADNVTNILIYGMTFP